MNIIIITFTNFFANISKIFAILKSFGTTNMQKKQNRK